MPPAFGVRVQWAQAEGYTPELLLSQVRHGLCWHMAGAR